MADRWRFLPLGEAALLAQVAVPDIDLANRYALALARALEAQVIPGLEGITPGIDSVLVRFDPLALSCVGLQARLMELANSVMPLSAQLGTVIDIPVAFGGEAGPDLDEVARRLDVSVSGLVDMLCAQPWRVMMIGFAHGFPYLGPLPPALHIPRRDTPRMRVPAGSVAIAAGMAGIYPAALPGGWHIVGRTPLRLFDPANEARPVLVQAGDGVRFVPMLGISDADDIAPRRRCA